MRLFIRNLTKVPAEFLVSNSFVEIYSLDRLVSFILIKQYPLSWIWHGAP